MPFQKGKSGNEKGKVPGTKNIKTVAWKQLGDFLTKEGAERAIKVLKEMPDKNFLYHYQMFLEYFKPKQQRTEIDSKGELKVIWQEKLSNESDNKTDEGS